MIIDKRIDAIKFWLSALYRTNKLTLEQASNDASFRRYYRVTIDNKTMIVMDAPPKYEDVGPFIKVAQFLAKHGLHVPEIIAEEKTDKVFVLYLPDNEVHELGLMIINYQIIASGHKTIFLGQSVPLESLKDILNFYDDITFLSNFTVMPDKEHIADYIKEFSQKILIKKSIKLWILGRMLEELNVKTLPKQITAFNSIEDLVKKL